MIEHEAINKRGALAMFKALESGSQVKAPVYQRQPTKSYLKTPAAPKPEPVIDAPKSILKKSEPVQSAPPPVVAQPDIVRESENQRGDLDDCKNVSVASIKSQWGKADNNNDELPEFDLLKDSEPELTSLKQLPEDYIEEKARLFVLEPLWVIVRAARVNIWSADPLM